MASQSWEMLTDLRDLDVQLSHNHPHRLMPASVLGAIVPEHCQRNPHLLCQELDDGWRPVLANSAASSIVHVPWLADLDALVHACGIRMERSSAGCASLTQVLLAGSCIAASYLV